MFFLKIKFVFWLNHHTQALPAGQKNCFYWDSGNMDRITKQQKNEVLRYLQKWTISTFPWMMTTSYLSLVRVQTWNNASYNVSLFPSHIFVDHGPLLLYYFFLRWYYFAKRGMRQRSPRRRKKKWRDPRKSGSWKQNGTTATSEIPQVSRCKCYLLIKFRDR